MARFDKPHSPSEPASPSERADSMMMAALQDVIVPDGLEARLLAAVQAEEPVSDSVSAEAGNTNGSVVAKRRTQNGWTRRRLLSAGIAAGLGSVLAGGAYAWSRRPLAIQEVADSTTVSLEDDNWVSWNPLVAGQTVAGVTFPASLRKSNQWQMRDTTFSSSVVAFNMSLPGCPKSVLFATKTARDLSAFATSPPPTPQHTQTGVWSHIAVWQNSSLQQLYVLALQSNRATIKRDYARLFRNGPAVQLA